MIVDVDDVRNDIPGVIALKGENYVYKQPDGYNCVYVDEETKCPSCLVGYYLINDLKVPISFFTGRQNFVEFPDLEGDLYREHGIIFTDEASEALTALQIYQDTGTSWGEAYEIIFGE